jgi:hypothetical protein
MNKEFVPYEEALALKELGFDEKCLGIYYPDLTDDVEWIPSETFKREAFIEKGFMKAPLYQQAFRWFRENYNKHNVPLGTLRLADEKVIFHINGPRNPVAFEKVYDTYEEAQIACLKMLIDSVIKQKEQ